LQDERHFGAGLARNAFVANGNTQVRPVKNIVLNVVAMMSAVSAVGTACELRPDTLAAWQDYVQGANARLEESLRPGNSFMQVDRNPEACSRLLRGEVIVVPAVEVTPKNVPSGMIHDWRAAAFVPAVRVQDVLGVLHSYDEYREFYKPTVIDSHELAGAEHGGKFSLTFRNRSLLSHTAIEADYQSTYQQLDEKRWYSIVQATRIQEIENYGREEEHKLDVGEGTGYVWRMQTIARLEERDGGVYVEMEVIALSRDVPSALRWIVGPMIRRYARNSLTAYMISTRDAVKSRCEAKQNTSPHAPESRLTEAFRKR